MPAYFCCANGCNSGARKKGNLEKYPWMKDITFHSFPHATRNKHLRKQWINMLRRGEDWQPNVGSRLCSIHFVGLKGPNAEHTVPTLFEYNNYGGMIRKTPKRKPPASRSRNTQAVVDWEDSLDESLILEETVPAYVREVIVNTGKYMFFLFNHGIFF